MLNNLTWKKKEKNIYWKCQTWAERLAAVFRVKKKIDLFVVFFIRWTFHLTSQSDLRCNLPRHLLDLKFSEEKENTANTQNSMSVLKESCAAQRTPPSNPRQRLQPTALNTRTRQHWCNSPELQPRGAEGKCCSKSLCARRVRFFWLCAVKLHGGGERRRLRDLLQPAPVNQSQPIKSLVGFISSHSHLWLKPAELEAVTPVGRTHQGGNSSRTAVFFGPVWSTAGCCGVGS